MPRNAAIFGITILLVGVLACQTTGPGPQATSSPASHPLQGEWEFVSGTMTRSDGSVRSFDSTQLRSIKVIGPSRFSFLTLRADGSLGKAAAGRYTVSGNTYTEYLDLVSPASSASTGVFTWRVEGDTWYHTGESGGTKFEEVWRRVK